VRIDLRVNEEEPAARVGSRLRGRLESIISTSGPQQEAASGDALHPAGMTSTPSHGYHLAP
jgi:hypothetical protein